MKEATKALKMEVWDGNKRMVRGIFDISGNVGKIRYLGAVYTVMRHRFYGYWQVQNRLTLTRALGK